ncbi:MAG: hypothetical protein HY906_27795, partial [Deltaproteobacteria bacterium]|nr:hypothetical protein [Deltaproteobacteria bacterium]
MATFVRAFRRVLALAIGAAMLAACRPPSSTSAAEPVIADELFGAPQGAGPRTFGGLQLLSVRQDAAIHLVFTVDPTRPTGQNLVEVILTPRDDGLPALMRTRLFNVAFKGPTVDGEPAPQVRRLVDEIVA